MLCADVIKAMREQRESLPLWAQYANSKAIPFSVDLGFSSVTMESSVLGNIKDRVSNAERVKGILFGMKTKNDIKINQCLQVKVDDDMDVIIKKNSGKEFLGIYSTGTIPDEEDFIFFEKIFKNIRHSLFLLKTCKQQDEESTVMYEVVYDRCRNNLKERLLIEQLRNYPNGVIESHSNNGDIPTKVFYFANVRPVHGEHTRFELDLNDEKKKVPFAKWQEALEEVLREKGITQQEMYDYLKDDPAKVEEFRKLATEKSGFSRREEVKEVKPNIKEYSVIIQDIMKKKEIDFLDIKEYHETGKTTVDYVKLAKEICKQVNLEILYHFLIGINDPSDKNPCIGFVQVLDEKFSGLGQTPQASKVKSTVTLLLWFSHLK